MEVAAVNSTAAPAVPQGKKDTPEKILDAAQQFEALLLSQMLRSIRESGKGWMGGDESATCDTATEFAEQQFAVVLAHQGGLGLANLIAKGLEPQQ
jgi:Rod binding domain-containing protein